MPVLLANPNELPVQSVPKRWLHAPPVHNDLLAPSYERDLGTSIVAAYEQARFVHAARSVDV